MTIFTHFLVTTAGVQILKLNGPDLVIAYAFGVGVDIDHIFKFPLYYKKNKLKTQTHYNWRTSLQEPVSFLWIVPFCIYFGTLIPIIFFTLHLLMDYSISYTKRPFFPFSSYKTKGFLLEVSDKLKELVLAAVFLCINLILILIKV